MEFSQMVRQSYPQRSCWAALGYGGKAEVEAVITNLTDYGFTLVGPGNPVPGAEVVYAPTGSVSPGGPNRKTRHWIGRWQRLPQMERRAVLAALDRDDARLKILV